MRDKIIPPLISAQTKESSRASVASVAGPDERSLIRSIPIHVTVFLTGAAVLVLEILGTRLLSPHFGANLLVWSALISVTMIALALGYWLGGRLADHHGNQGLLEQLIAGAAVWIAIIPTMVRAVSDPLLELDYRLGVLLAAFVSFGPALFLMGMVTPIAVKLSVPDLKHVGRSSGAVYACSTAGGIFGALGAGFFLFPVIPHGRGQAMGGRRAGSAPEDE